MYCQSNPPSLPHEVFADMHFLPSPTLTSHDKYKKFEEVYGTSTTEKDRPSLQQSGNKAADEPFKHLLTAARVRSTVMCGEWLKPRCVYSATKLSLDEANAVDEVKDDNTYTCGSKLFIPDHRLSGSVIVRVGVTCASPIETCYYVAVSVHFPAVCYYCGQGDPDQLLDDTFMKELKQQFATVRPLCRECRKQGEAKTRAPNNVTAHCPKRRKSD